MKQHPYYNRPSLQTSFQIAAIALICLVIMLLGLMVANVFDVSFKRSEISVSEVVNDFDNTSIHKKEDPIADTFIKRETIRERKLRWLKNRKMSGSIY